MSKAKRKHLSKHPTDPDRTFRLQALKLAREALKNAVEWTGKKETSWALIEAQRAVKLLEIAR